MKILPTKLQEELPMRILDADERINSVERARDQEVADKIAKAVVAHKRGETRVAQLQRELGEVRNSQGQSAKGIADAECARGSAQATIVDLKEQIRTARERFAKVKLERSSFERRLETDQSDVAELQIEKAKQEQDYLKRIADLESAWKLSEEG